MANLRDRFVTLHWAKRLGLLVILGALAGLGQAPTDLWPITITAFAVLLLLFPAVQGSRSAAFTAWAFGVGYFALTLRWIIEPFLVDIARHGWMAPFALTFMAAGFALFWGLAGYCAKRFASGAPIAFVLMLVLAEVTRSLILTGFPWALVGHIWIPTSIAQLAAFGGPHLLSLLTMMVAWSIAALVTGGKPRLVGSAFVVVLCAVGWGVHPGSAPPALPDAPIVRLVQPNAPQHQKWDPKYRHVFFNRLIGFTARGAVPDLVVWPETSVPTLLNYLDDDLSILSDAARGAPLVFGIQRRGDGSEYFNSMVVLGQGGMIGTTYDKRHLVPFGEYFPGGELAGRLGLRGIAASEGGGFTAGAGGATINVPGIGAAIPLICYEGIFAEEIGIGPERARLMILITNDAWFGKAAGPFQHMAQARLRAIEQGLPMVRVANTGVSAMIDAKGRVMASIPLDQEGALDVALPPALSPTLYVRWGDWPLVTVLILLTLGSVVVRTRNSD